MSVCYRFNCSSVDLCWLSVVATNGISTILQRFELFDFAKGAMFKSYGIIYLFDRDGHI